MRREVFELYHDAIKGRTTELLSKVFDHVRVSVDLDQQCYAIRVTASCLHRGNQYHRAQMFDVYSLDARMYIQYLRDEMPADFARTIIDYIVRS